MESREIFKDIKGYENIYRVSNLGRVYSVKRGIIISLIKKKSGYYTVNLYKNGEMKTFLIHRLVACNFIENPNNLPQINHVDGNKANNKVENLEWISGIDNMRHAYENNIGGFKEKALATINEINNRRSYKKVLLKKGNEILSFNSVSEAANLLGLKRDCIINSIRKKHKLFGFEVFGYKIANEESL